MNLEFIALGGALDATGNKPPIGGSAYALIDRDSMSALVIDFGAYQISQEERERHSAYVLELEESEQRTIGGIKLPPLPKLRSDVLSGVIDGDLAEITEQCFPTIEPLAEMRHIAVVATHAHLDHIGALIFLKKQCPHAKVYMTKPTRDICLWSWYDSFKIARKNDQRLFFTSFDIEDLVQEVKIIRPGDTVETGPFSLAFFSAGHILGAVSVVVRSASYGMPTLFFTGDMSMSHQHSVSRGELPDAAVDVLVTESTYAGQDQEMRELVEQRLARDVRACLENGGKVLFPTLAIGRPVEVYSILKKHGINADFKVYIDGSARDIAKIYVAYGKVSPEIERHFIGVRKHREDVMRSDKPVVVIAPSGMLTGGFAMDYFATWAGDQRNMVAFSSYVDPCTPGYRVLTAPWGSSMQLFDKRIELNASIVQYGLSAHMSHREILGIIDALAPRETFLVHGTSEGMDALIEDTSVAVHKTAINTFYQLT